MAYKIRRADYFYATVNDPPEEADKLLSHLAQLGINSRVLRYFGVGPTQVIEC